MPPPNFEDFLRAKLLQQMAPGLGTGGPLAARPIVPRAHPSATPFQGLGGSTDPAAFDRIVAQQSAVQSVLNQQARGLGPPPESLASQAVAGTLYHAMRGGNQPPLMPVPPPLPTDPNRLNRAEAGAVTGAEGLMRAVSGMPTDTPLAMAYQTHISSGLSPTEAARRALVDVSAPREGFAGLAQDVSVPLNKPYEEKSEYNAGKMVEAAKLDTMTLEQAVAAGLLLPNATDADLEAMKNERVFTVFGGPGMMGVPLDPTFDLANFRRTEAWRELRDGLIDAYENGYTAYENEVIGIGIGPTGQATAKRPVASWGPGERAAHEYWIGTKPTWQRILQTIGEDPLNLTPLPSAAGRVLGSRGARLLAEEGGEAGVKRLAGEAAVGAGRALDVPDLVLNRAADNVIAAPLRLARAGLGQIPGVRTAVEHLAETPVWVKARAAVEDMVDRYQALDAAHKAAMAGVGAPPPIPPAPLPLPPGAPLPSPPGARFTPREASPAGPPIPINGWQPPGAVAPTVPLPTPTAPLVNTAPPPDWREAAINAGRTDLPTVAPLVPAPLVPTPLTPTTPRPDDAGRAPTMRDVPTLPGQKPGPRTVKPLSREERNRLIKEGVITPLTPMPGGDRLLDWAGSMREIDPAGWQRFLDEYKPRAEAHKALQQGINDDIAAIAKQLDRYDENGKRIWMEQNERNAIFESRAPLKQEQVVAGIEHTVDDVLPSVLKAFGRAPDIVPTRPRKTMPQGKKASWREENLPYLFERMAFTLDDAEFNRIMATLAKRPDFGNAPHAEQITQRITEARDRLKQTLAPAAPPARPVPAVRAETAPTARTAGVSSGGGEPDLTVLPRQLPTGRKALYVGRSAEDTPVRIVEKQDGGYEVHYRNEDGGWTLDSTSEIRAALGGRLGDPEAYITIARVALDKVERIRRLPKIWGEGLREIPPVRVDDDIAEEAAALREIQANARYERGEPLSPEDEVILFGATETPGRTVPTPPAALPPGRQPSWMQHNLDQLVKHDPSTPQGHAIWTGLTRGDEASLSRSLRTLVQQGKNPLTTSPAGHRLRGEVYQASPDSVDQYLRIHLADTGITIDVQPAGTNRTYRILRDGQEVDVLKNGTLPAAVARADMAAGPSPPRTVPTPAGPQAVLPGAEQAMRPSFSTPPPNLPTQSTAPPMRLDAQVLDDPAAQREAQRLAGQSDLFGEAPPARTEPTAPSSLPDYRTARLDDLKTDTKRFQNRAADFSEERVQIIVDDYRPNDFEPIDVADNGDGTFTVLEGHSRREAWRRLVELGKVSPDAVPIHIQRGTDAEIEEFARFANLRKTGNTSSEKGAIIGRMVAEGETIKAAALRVTDGNVAEAKRLYAVSKLPRELQTAVNEKRLSVMQGSMLGEAIAEDVLSAQEAVDFYLNRIAVGGYSDPDLAGTIKVLAQMRQAVDAPQTTAMFGDLALGGSGASERFDKIDQLAKTNRRLTSQQRTLNSAIKAGGPDLKRRPWPICGRRSRGCSKSRPTSNSRSGSRVCPRCR